MDDNEIDIEDLNDAEALGQQLIDTILERSPTAEIHALIEAHAPLWYQSYDGMSALHAAVLIEDAKLVRLLLEKGSIWNAGTYLLDQRGNTSNVSSVDGLHNTAGDIALSLNNQECYELVRDAGVRTGTMLFLYL
jgi:protein arginine N-methyltransferase 2